MAGEAACPYSKQFVHSKSSQYKKMKQEWRNNVYLARYFIFPAASVLGRQIPPTWEEAKASLRAVAP